MSGRHTVLALLGVVLMSSFAASVVSASVPRVIMAEEFGSLS
jgi:hypothetical protein